MDQAQGQAQAQAQPNVQEQPQPQQKQNNPQEMPGLAANLEINPNDTPEVRLLKDLAKAQLQERNKEAALRQQQEQLIANMQKNLNDAQNEKNIAEHLKQQLEHEKVKEQQARLNLEKELQKLEHEKLVRQMAQVNINVPPPAVHNILQPPKLTLKNPQEMQLQHKQEVTKRIEPLDG